VIQQWGLSRARPGPVQAFELRRPPRQARARRQEQKEGQQHGNVGGNRSERMVRHRRLLLGTERRAPVVIRPRALESESETSAQQSQPSIGRIGHADRRTFVFIRRIGLLVFPGVHIEVRFHAAREQVEVRISDAPKRSYTTAAAVARRPDEGAAAARSPHGFRGRPESVAIEFGQPGALAPLDPDALRRHAQ
jgi:hypothetical protein